MSRRGWDPQTSGLFHLRLDMASLYLTLLSPGTWPFGVDALSLSEIRSCRRLVKFTGEDSRQRCGEFPPEPYRLDASVKCRRTRLGTTGRS
ncbi:hypothetical protein BJV77DRAFT_129844 [Russula vinacea]|nr:hypothetical protein BJV77DRAFT_129844 [Russula vinacea]